MSKRQKKQNAPKVQTFSGIGKREENEDRAAHFVESPIFAIADGMGGHENGAEAAQFAVDAFVDLALIHNQSPLSESDTIVEFIKKTNEALIEAARPRFSNLHDGGTTLSIAAINREKKKVFFGHAGDTRIYLFRLVTRRGFAEIRKWQLTTDQGSGNILYQALGKNNPINPIGGESDYEENDLLILTTDGLHDVLDEVLDLENKKGKIQTELEQIVLSWFLSRKPLHALTKALVSCVQGLDLSRQDNYTAICVVL